MAICNVFCTCAEICDAIDVFDTWKGVSCGLSLPSGGSEGILGHDTPVSKRSNGEEGNGRGMREMEGGGGRLKGEEGDGRERREMEGGGGRWKGEERDGRERREMEGGGGKWKGGPREMEGGWRWKGRREMGGGGGKWRWTLSCSLGLPLAMSACHVPLPCPLAIFDFT